MKKTLVLLGSLLVGIGIFLYMILHFNIKEALSSFAVFSPKTLFLYLLVSVIIMIVLVFRWKRIMNTLDIKIPFLKLFLYKLSGYAVGYLVPTKKVGVDARTYLLFKEKKIVSSSKGASSVMLDNMLEFAGDIFFAFVGFIVLISFFNISLKLKIALIAALCASALLVGSFFYSYNRGKHVFSRLIEFLRIDRIKVFNLLKNWVKSSEKHNIRFIKNNRKEVFISFLISLSLWILMFIEYKFALKIIGYTVGFKEIFVILTFVSIAYLIPIPAALGVLEASQVSAFSLLGMRPSTAIALSFIVRARDLVWTILGLTVLYAHSASSLKDYFKKNDTADRRGKGRA